MRLGSPCPLLPPAGRPAAPDARAAADSNDAASAAISRRRAVAACGLAWAGWVGAADFSGARGAQLRLALQQQLNRGQAGEAAFRDAASLPAERLEERARLLRRGEASLARLDTAAALAAFERAALILHAADSEMALVRGHMQAGEYRRALAFGAHTAGAHLDVVGGSALYAWLLRAGGQAAVAQRLLDDAQARAPEQPLLQAVRRSWQAGAPVADTPELLQPPVRLAPYGQAVPRPARPRGSGFLLGSGRHALVALAAVPPSGRLWLRNGLGQLAAAKPLRRDARLGVALLGLDRPFPTPAKLDWAEADAFPGSVGHAVEYGGGGDSPAAAPTPAWPLLHTGFMGGVVRGESAAKSPQRLLGLTLPPGPRGGPVFNAAGQFSGLALDGRQPGEDRFVPVSALREALAGVRDTGSPASTGGKPAAGAAMDEVYEAGLKVCLQVLA